MTQTAVLPQKTVRIIPAQVNIHDEIKSAYRQIRVAAYCRVSTKEEEQLNSYEVQTKYYTEKINSEPKWTLVGIFVDKEISGCIAQSESENISANVKWGKAQSAKEGNVPFQYKRFLGYRKGADGKPEIDPEQAKTVKRIYGRFLAGDSFAKIADDLNTDGVPTPSAKAHGFEAQYNLSSPMKNTKAMRCLTKHISRTALLKK